MLDCAEHEDDNQTKCINYDPNDTAPYTCGSNTAYAYFISFYVLCSFLVSKFGKKF